MTFFVPFLKFIWDIKSQKKKYCFSNFRKIDNNHSDDFMQHVQVEASQTEARIYNLKIQKYVSTIVYFQIIKQISTPFFLLEFIEL